MSVTDSADRLRVGFVSAVEIGAACIDEIHEIGGRLDLIMTLEDTADRHKSGRADLADLATRHGCELVKIRDINDAQGLGALRAANLDWLFIIGWSQIASAGVLSIPSKGTIGAHPTLLPVGRGRAPIPWAILKGLPETGVTFFLVDEGVDTGPIIEQAPIPLEPTEDAGSLYRKVVTVHRRLIGEVWRQLTDDIVDAEPQDESRTTYWPKRTPADGEIHSTMTVEDIDRLVRAVTRPYPGAFVLREGRVVRIWEGTANGSLERLPMIEIPAIDGTWWATDFEHTGPGDS
jgi:methionyl-tRNA formyltransferase